MQRTIWRGQSVTLTIGQIQNATKAHISKYVFYGSSELGGLSEYDTASTSVEAQSQVNSEKNYTITSYLLYRHNFAGSTTVATSNKVDNVLTVRQPLDEASLVKIAPVNAPMNGVHYQDWVWSNATSATFKVIPTFTSYLPWSKRGIFESDATNPAAPKGSTNTLRSEDISTTNELAWSKTTGSTTDLGKASENITVYVKSTEDSAPSERRITGKTATFVVRNAVTALSGLVDKTLYAGSTAVTQSVTITPAIPYSKELILVDDMGQDVSSKSITSTGGAKVSLSGQTITLDASKVTPGTAKQIIKFKVRSRQSNDAVDTKEIIFTVNAVANISNKDVVEGQSITVAAGIGDITSAVARPSDPVRVTHSGGSVTITGTAVDEDTAWVVTVTNAAGAHITISGKTKYLANVSTSINTGDYIIIGTEILTGLTTNFEIVSGPSKGTASITSDGKLKYEASTKDGAITEGTCAIKVKGANGATQTVNIRVSNITAELS